LGNTAAFAFSSPFGAATATALKGKQISHKLKSRSKEKAVEHRKKSEEVI